MDEALWRRLEEFAASYPRALAGPVDPEEVDAAEAEVRTPFPAPYRAFLLRWGGGYVGHQPVAGVRPSPSGHRARVDGDVVRLCEHFREQGWPGSAAWICVSSDGEGRAVGLDPEGRVVTSDLQRPLEVTVLAPDFGTWLHRVLDEAEAMEHAVAAAGASVDGPRAPGFDLRWAFLVLVAVVIAFAVVVALVG